MTHFFATSFGFSKKVVAAPAISAPKDAETVALVGGVQDPATQIAHGAGIVVAVVLGDPQNNRKTEKKPGVILTQSQIQGCPETSPRISEISLETPLRTLVHRFIIGHK